MYMCSIMYVIIRVCECMFACMHICMYVHVYACTCIRAYVRVYVCMYACMYASIYVRKYIKHVCKYLETGTHHFQELTCVVFFRNDFYGLILRVNVTLVLIVGALFLQAQLVQITRGNVCTHIAHKQQDIDIDMDIDIYSDLGT